MFKVGDIVEFWLPDGKQYRYGRLARKEKGICYVVSKCFINRRVYKLKEKELNYYRGEWNVKSTNR